MSTTSTTAAPSVDAESAAHDPDADPWRIATSRAIHPSTCDAGEPLIAVIARGLAAASAPWELTTGTVPDERCYELLLSTPRYDAWLIHWPAGTGLDAHDHGRSAGAFAVVSGTLDEETTDGGVTSTRRVHEGGTIWFEADHVHAVVNRGDVGATSVHVYSPPLRTMGFYRSEGSGAALPSSSLSPRRTACR